MTNKTKAKKPAFRKGDLLTLASHVEPPTNPLPGFMPDIHKDTLLCVHAIIGKGTPADPYYVSVSPDGGLNRFSFLATDLVTTGIRARFPR